MTLYAKAFVSGFLRQSRNRSDLVFTMAFYALILVAWGAVWWAAMRATGGSLQGYDFQAMFWYIAGTEASVIVASSRRIEQIGADIAGGVIEHEMLRPASVVGIRLAVEIGQSMARLVWVLPAMAVLGILYTGGVPHAGAFLLGVVAICLGAACNNIGIYLFSSLAFWSRDSKAAWFVYQKLVFLPGGMLIPMQFMPATFAAVAWVLPFWSMAYAPGRLTAGFVEPWLIVGQAGWMAVMTGLTVAAFGWGERRIVKGLV